MRSYPHQRRHQRRKTDVSLWQQTIDQLAMHLCPPQEWEEYMARLNRLEWLVQQFPPLASRLVIFPAWKKYRREAQQVITLYQTLPFLRHLPLRWTSFLGRLLF